MAGLRPVEDIQRLRARRWDAIVLGTGVSGLIAAARLGGAGHRVLVVEEDAARAQHPALREPFFLAGARDSGALDACLRELKVALIDQRRVAAERLAYQVVSAKLRLDVGAPPVTAEELDIWGLAAPEAAAEHLRAIVDAAEAERRIMLESPLVRVGRRLSLARSGTPGSHVRGWPAEAGSPSPELRAVLDAQVAALSNLATAAPPPEARARLLGTALAGGAGFGDGPPWLSGLLRKRVEAVYADFRTVAGRFDLVSVDNQPGIVVENTHDLWIGRTLVIAAAPSAVAGAMLHEPAPDFLRTDRPRRRRLQTHLRVDREVVPPGMSARLVIMGDGPAAGSGAAAGDGSAAAAARLEDRVVSVTAYPGESGSDRVDLIGRIRIADDEDPAEADAEVLRRVQALMPFSEGRITVREQRRPLWDDDGWLEDPQPGRGWPSEVDLRVPGRAPVYRLDRAGVAGLGVEGDLLLGWRAGDAIAAELG